MEHRLKAGAVLIIITARCNPRGRENVKDVIAHASACVLYDSSGWNEASQRGVAMDQIIGIMYSL